MIPVEVPRGSVLFFHGHLLHKSGHNTTTQPRRTYVAHYMSAETEPVHAGVRSWPFTQARGVSSSRPGTVQPIPTQNWPISTANVSWPNAKETPKRRRIKCATKENWHLPHFCAT